MIVELVKECRTRDEWDHFLRQNSPELTEAERRELSGYTSAGHAEINDALRAGRVPGELARTIETLQKLLLKQPRFPDDLVLYRGVRSGAINLDDYVEGSLVRLDTFVSTSLDKDTARIFSGGRGYTFHVQPLRSGLYVEPFSAAPGEFEAILSHSQIAFVKVNIGETTIDVW